MGSPIDSLLRRAVDGEGPMVFLTGAGISAESGIPTFRGAEGYWRVGSRNYRPMELATRAAFEEAHDDAWGWYLYRRSACHAAAPNAAHRALVEAERALGDRFLLVTQNVDGLHLRAGNSVERTYQIHGNIDFMRCSSDCSRDRAPVPDEFRTWQSGRVPGAGEKALLRCARCGAVTRPHVLWFDEYYDEAWFRFESSLLAAARASLLVVIGTSGATNLPTQMCQTVARRGAPMIVVDVERTVFSETALRAGGAFVQGTASAEVPALVEGIVDGASR
jgi:NAD-dependent deacetylase